MSDSYRNGSGDHNRIDHESKVHLWGHQSPITVDHTSYKFEHDPDLIVEVDLPYNKFPVRKSSAGIKRISSRSASAKSGSGTERSLPSRGTPLKSRSRPMKPHETEPFLAVDAMTDRISVTPTSNTARLPQRPTSSTIRRGRAPTVTGRLYAPDGRSPSPYINSGRNTPASSIYVSPTNKQKAKPNVHIRSPFKHSVQKTETPKDRASSPSQDLKELTAFATFHVGKMLSREPVEHRQKVNGKLLKGKLKPLKPVDVKGPSIEKCRGIVSESRSSLPTPNRTLARRREILERIPNIHEFIYDRPRTEESIHRTSRASSVDENRDNIIKGEISDEDLGRSSQLYQSDDLPIAASSSRTTDLGPTGPTPTPRMFVTEINNKGKENTPFDNSVASKVTNGMELQKSGKSQDLPEENKDTGSKLDRPSTAGKLVRFAEGSKDDPEASKDMKEQQNAKLLEGQRENTVNTMSEEPTQMEIEMKVDITIIDKSESQKIEENKAIQGEIKILDKGDETNPPEKKKSKESCKPDDSFMKKDDHNDDKDDNMKDKNDNKFVDSKTTSISPSQQAGSNQPTKKSSGNSEKNGKQNTTSHTCRSKDRYKAPSTLQIQSVLHDGSVYYTVGAESPRRRSPSPARSPSPHSSKLSSDSAKSKHNRLMRPSSASKKTKPKRKSSLSSESASSMFVDRRSPSPSRKVYFEGDTPPRQSIFTEEKKGENIEVTLRQDKEMTFDDLEQEIVAIQESIHKRLDTDEFNIPSNLDPDSSKTDEDDVVLKQVEENILHLELNSKCQQADLDLETMKESEQNYTDLLELYRMKCMTVSENCGCISDTLMTPRRANTPAANRRHSLSRPSSASSRKSSSRKLQRRNSFHFERPSSKSDVSGQKVLFKSPSVVSMTTDSGYSMGGDTDDYKIPSLCLLSAATDSDVCLTDRSEGVKPLLAMVCDELPADEDSETTVDERKQGSGDVEKDFQVVAKALEFSKPKHVKKQNKGPTAPFAPLCFTLNARPPAGYLYYFAYGPDMNPSRIATYLKREIKERFWGLLYGFQLVFNKIGVDIEAGGFANIEFNPFCSVEGVVYQITPEELEILDKHVGYPEHFTHLMLPLWMSNSLSPDQYGVAQYCVPAVMYIAQDQYINKNQTINCDYALQQCIKSSDLVTPDYRDHMVNYCQPINEQVMCVN